MPDVVAITVWDALVEAINQGMNPPLGPNNSQILAARRVYRGTAPPNAPLGYFLLGQVGSFPEGFYAQEGENGTYRIHCWATSPDNAMRLAKWLVELVAGRTLVLDGATLIRGSIVTVDGPFSDPDATAWQMEVRYRAQTLET